MGAALKSGKKRKKKGRKEERRTGLPSHPKGLGVGRRHHPEGNRGTTQAASSPVLLCRQPTWRPCFRTSLAGSSSTPSSTWVPSGSSRCSSRTRPSCRASCSNASSQVRGRGHPGAGGGGWGGEETGRGPGADQVGPVGELKAAPPPLSPEGLRLVLAEGLWAHCRTSVPPLLLCNSGVIVVPALSGSHEN